MDLLKHVHLKTLRTFLKQQGLKNKEQQTTFIESVRDAMALTKDNALIESRALFVNAMLRQIKDFNTAIAEFDRELNQMVVPHPDYDLFHSLPGAGAALIPRLIAAFGTDRDRY